MWSLLLAACAPTSTPPSCPPPPPRPGEVRVRRLGCAADLVLVRGGQQLFVPGEDPWDLPLTSDADALGILTPDPALGPAVATRSDAPRTLLYAGPIRVVLHEAREGTVTRWWALGADHAEAAARLEPERERWDNDAGLVEVRDADGRTLSRCRSETWAVPDGAVG